MSSSWRQSGGCEILTQRVAGQPPCASSNGQSPDGEIGRRSGLKIRRPQGRGGSSPPLGTKKTRHSSRKRHKPSRCAAPHATHLTRYKRQEQSGAGKITMFSTLHQEWIPLCAEFCSGGAESVHALIVFLQCAEAGQIRFTGLRGLRSFWISIMLASLPLSKA